MKPVVVLVVLALSVLLFSGTWTLNSRPAAAKGVAASVVYLPLVARAPVPAPPATATPTLMPTATPKPAPVPSAQLLPNGDFEQGATVWTAYGAVYYLTGAQYAHSGTHSAGFGGDGEGAQMLGQPVQIPADKPYLSFWDYNWSEETDCSADMGVIWIDANPQDNDPGILVAGYPEFCKSASHSDWRKHVVDLRPYVGMRGMLWFDLDLLLANASYWTIDDVAFQNVPY